MFDTSYLPKHSTRGAAQKAQFINKALPVFFRVPIIIAFLMAVTILGTLFFGRIVAFASIPVFVIIITICAFKNQTLCIAVFMGYSAMEGMYKYLSEFSQVVYGIKPLLSLVVFIGLCFFLKRNNIQSIKSPLFLPLIIFAVWGAVEASNPLGSGPVASVLALWVWYLAPMIMYLVVINCVKNHDQVETLYFTLIAISIIVSAFAVFQYYMGQSWTEAHLPGYASIKQANWFVKNEAGKITATSWTPASTTPLRGGGSAWAYLGIVVMLGRLFSSVSNRQQKALLFVFLTVNVAGLLVSGSRLWVITAIVIGATLLVLLSRTSHQLFLNLGILLVVFIISGVGLSVAQSISGGIIASRYAKTLAHPVETTQQDRGGNFTYLVPLLVTYPFGVGFQRGTEQGTYDAGQTGLGLNRETEFNAVANDMGVVGLLLLYILLALIISRAVSTYRQIQQPNLRLSAVTGFGLLFGYFIVCFGGPELQSADLFWIIAGIVTVLPALKRPVSSMDTI